MMSAVQAMREKGLDPRRIEKQGIDCGKRIRRACVRTLRRKGMSRKNRTNRMCAGGDGQTYEFIYSNLGLSAH